MLPVAASDGEVVRTIWRPRRAPTAPVRGPC